MRGRLWGAAVIVPMMAALSLGGTAATGQSPAVLLVGPPGYPGAQYSSIQAAVNGANAGDWILVAPGIYHEKGLPGTKDPAGVWIGPTKNGIHLRGMDRNQVIVDGTNLVGSADGSGTLPATAANLAAACASAPGAQDFGPKDSSGSALGRNGIEVYKASGTWVENLSACNFLVGSGHTGNEIWWNAGDGSGQTSPMSLWGNYITATSTYYLDGNHADAEYGIFASNIAPDRNYGASSWNHTYANNMGDSDYYVGACADCNMTIDDAHAVNSALGYSGTNGSGRLLIENSEWDHNRGGIAPSTLNNDDSPSPEDGNCPPGITGPDAADRSKCWVARKNNLHDNNNADTPAHGIAAALPVGGGIELVATQNDLLVRNNVHDNGAWGIVMYDYPDSETPPAEAVNQGQACRGGNLNPALAPLGSNPVQPVCDYPSIGNNTVNNSFSHNGSFGNPTNGDIGNGGTYTPYNCFSGNTDAGSAATVWPPTDGSGCNPGDNTVLSEQLVCDSGIFGAVTSGTPLQSISTCPSAPGISYPKLSQSTCGSADSPGAWQGDPQNGACMIPLAATLQQPEMPDPCAGAPPNAYCSATTRSSQVSAATVLPNTSRLSPGRPFVLLVLLISTLVLLRWRLRRLRR